MIGPSVQQKVDPLHTEMAEVKRLIGIQDELTIAGLCKGIDTTESEGKSRVLRISLEVMKAHKRKQAGTKQ
jgi:hypothetical protein